MQIHQVHVARYESGEQRVVTTDELAAFQREAPYGYTMAAVPAIQTEDGWLVLAAPAPLQAWTLAAYEKAERERDAAIGALPQTQRDLLFPNHETLEERRAKRAAEDAEAEKRAAKAKKG